MIWKLHQTTPQKQIIDKIINALKEGEVLAVPTDTVYAFVCLHNSPASIKELYKIKKMDTTHHLSLLCRDIAMASKFSQSIPNHVFRFMKSVTPGPYTFILNAGQRMDRRGTGKKKTVGIRIVDHALHRELMKQLDLPLVSTSITMGDNYCTSSEDLNSIYGHSIYAVLDGGIRKHEFSTILDCTSGSIVLKRRGIGEINSTIIINEEDTYK